MRMEGQDRGVPTIFVVPLMQFFVGLLLFIALLHGQRDLVVFSLLVLGVVFGAKLWTRISLSGIKSHSVVDKQKVFPGEKLTLRINAENKKFFQSGSRWKSLSPAPSILPPVKEH
jgi:hypothetical protein